MSAFLAVIKKELNSVLRDRTMVIAILIQLFIEDPPYIRANRPPRIAFLGFGLLALWIGCLQIALDRGQQEDWLSSAFIRTLLIGGGLGLALFIFREMMTDHPLINLRVLKNRKKRIRCR